MTVNDGDGDDDDDDDDDDISVNQLTSTLVFFMISKLIFHCKFLSCFWNHRKHFIKSFATAFFTNTKAAKLMVTVFV